MEIRSKEDDYPEIKDVKNSGLTWIEGNRLIWCFTDEKGRPASLPEQYIVQKSVDSIRSGTRILRSVLSAVKFFT